MRSFERQTIQTTVSKAKLSKPEPSAAIIPLVLWMFDTSEARTLQTAEFFV